MYPNPKHLCPKIHVKLNQLVSLMQLHHLSWSLINLRLGVLKPSGRPIRPMEHLLRSISLWRNIRRLLP